MKQDKVINIILAVVNAILVIVCAVLYLKTDRTEPRFVVQPAVIVYTPGMEETALYEGLSAHDDRDGEITDKIVVEKIVENQAESTAIVYYAVSDAAGNTAKFSKLFRAEYPVEVSAAASESGGGVQVMMELQKGQPAQEETMEDGADRDDSGADEDSAEDDEDGGSGEENGETPADAENGRTDDDRADDADSENDRAGNEENAASATPAPAPAARNSGAPELVFRTTEVKVDSGTNVPWTEIISTLRDDKDDYATLYYNLQVGQYNRNKPGTYQVDVYTEDSDGNRSQTVPVTIIVR